MNDVQVTVKLNDEDVVVVGCYHEGEPMSADRINPPEDRDFEIEKVIYKNVNVFPILSDETIEELSILAAEKLD